MIRRREYERDPVAVNFDQTGPSKEKLTWNEFQVRAIDLYHFVVNSGLRDLF